MTLPPEDDDPVHEVDGLFIATAVGVVAWGLAFLALMIWNVTA